MGDLTPVSYLTASAMLDLADVQSGQMTRIEKARLAERLLHERAGEKDIPHVLQR